MLIYKFFNRFGNIRPKKSLRWVRKLLRWNESNLAIFDQLFLSDPRHEGPRWGIT